MKKVLLILISIFWFSNVYASESDLSFTTDHKTGVITYKFSATSCGLDKAWISFWEYQINSEDKLLTKQFGNEINVVFYEGKSSKEKHEVSINVSKDLKKDTFYIAVPYVHRNGICGDDLQGGSPATEAYIVITDKNPTDYECGKYKLTLNDYKSLQPAQYFTRQGQCLLDGCFLKKLTTRDDDYKCYGEGTPTTEPIAPSPTTCQDIFGSFYDDLQMGFKAFKIVAPLLVLIFSVSEYLKAVFSKDAEGLKDANKRLIRRGILLVVLFFLPTILNILLSLLLGTEFGTCIS